MFSVIEYPFPRLWHSKIKRPISYNWKSSTWFLNAPKICQHFQKWEIVGYLTVKILVTGSDFYKCSRWCSFLCCKWNEGTAVLTEEASVMKQAQRRTNRASCIKLHSTSQRSLQYLTSGTVKWTKQRDKRIILI